MQRSPVSLYINRSFSWQTYIKELFVHYAYKQNQHTYPHKLKSKVWTHLLTPIHYDFNTSQGSSYTRLLHILSNTVWYRLIIFKRFIWHNKILYLHLPGIWSCYSSPIQVFSYWSVSKAACNSISNFCFVTICYIFLNHSIIVPFILVFIWYYWSILVWIDTVFYINGRPVCKSGNITMQVLHYMYQNRS